MSETITVLQEVEIEVVAECTECGKAVEVSGIDKWQGVHTVYVIPCENCKETP